MTLPNRTLVLLVVAAFLAAACTAGEDPSSAGPSEDAAEQGPASPGNSSVVGAVALVPGAQVDVDPAIIEAAGQWIGEDSGLSPMLQEEIFLDRVTRTRDVYHLTFLQQHDEVSVRGAQFVIHIRDTGEVLGASQSLTDALPGEGVSEQVTQDEAVDIAEKAVRGPVEGEPLVASTWLEDGDELRLGWEIRITTSDPPSGFSVVVDATDGAVLSVDRLASDRQASSRSAERREIAQASACNAPPPPSACIFVVDPIYASGNPDIDPAQANSILVGVSLPNLIDPAAGDLVGRYAQVAPSLLSAYHDADGVYGEAGRGGQDVTFEAGMTYYWVDYTQQVVQELGYDYHSTDPVDLVPIEPQFPDNAFYLFTEDRIHMGVGSDGVNEAEDAQGIIHEYGHALLQAAVPDIITEEGGAFHESFGDLVSVFTTLEFRNGDIPCLFAWAERGQCLRRVDTSLVYPDDLRFEVHLDGELFNGAIWDIFVAVLDRDTGLAPEQCQDRAANPCDATRDQVYGTLLGSLPFLTPALNLNDAATAFAVSDQTFYEGQNADIIQQVFAAHGLAASGTPNVQVEGLMDFQSAESVASVKIEHEYRGDLDLRLAVVDGAGQELCNATLVSPNPDDDGDNVTGRFRLDGTPCAQFLPPSPDQIWVLTVVDTLEQDEGTLFQFAVTHQGQRFIAAGLPAIIPDADAIGVSAVIGGDVPAAAPVDGPAPDVDGGDAAGSVQAGIELTHTYVGDLQIQVIVANLDGGDVLCRVDLHEPDPQDDSDDLTLAADVSDCAAFYPPSPNQAWVLRVADLAAADTGQVTAYTLTGPDGTVRTGQVPQAIPDEDRTGLLIPITD
ncbi:MAG: proprotein convertase P-domain-containing protein [Euzebya sp.]